MCGGFSDSLSRCAGLVEEGVNVSFVDVNMGCPIDTICDRSAGSSLLKKINKIEEILKGMSRVLSCPLTIKIRKGYEDSNDVSHYCFTFIHLSNLHALQIFKSLDQFQLLKVSQMYLSL